MIPAPKSSSEKTMPVWRISSMKGSSTSGTSIADASLISRIRFAARAGVWRRVRRRMLVQGWYPTDRADMFTATRMPGLRCKVIRPIVSAAQSISRPSS